MGIHNNLSQEMANKHESQTKEASAAWLKHEKVIRGLFGEPGQKGKPYSEGGSKPKPVSWNYVKDNTGKTTGIALSHGATSMIRNHSKANPDSDVAKAYKSMSALSQKHAGEMVGLVHGHMQKIFTRDDQGRVSDAQHKAQALIYHGIHNTSGQRLSVTGYTDKKEGPKSVFYDPQKSINDYVSSTKGVGMSLSRSGANLHIGDKKGRRVISMDRRYRGPTIYAAWNVNKAGK